MFSSCWLPCATGTPAAACTEAGLGNESVAGEAPMAERDGLAYFVVGRLAPPTSSLPDTTIALVVARSDLVPLAALRFDATLPPGVALHVGDSAGCGANPVAVTPDAWAFWLWGNVSLGGTHDGASELQRGPITMPSAWAAPAEYATDLSGELVTRGASDGATIAIADLGEVAAVGPTATTLAFTLQALAGNHVEDVSDVVGGRAIWREGDGSAHTLVRQQTVGGDTEPLVDVPGARVVGFGADGVTYAWLAASPGPGMRDASLVAFVSPRADRAVDLVPRAIDGSVAPGWTRIHAEVSRVVFGHGWMGIVLQGSDTSHRILAVEIATGRALRFDLGDGRRVANGVFTDAHTMFLMVTSNDLTRGWLERVDLESLPAVFPGDGVLP
jgi:hypothetical protein